MRYPAPLAQTVSLVVCPVPVKRGASGVSRYWQCNAGIEPLEHGKLLWAVLRYLRDADLLGLLRGLLLRSFSLRRLCRGRSSLSLLRLLLLLPRRCGDRDLHLAISTLAEEVTCQQVPR